MAIAKWKRFTKEELETFVQESTSFTQVAKKIGYKPNNSGIYSQLKKAFETYNIDYSHFKGHAWNKIEENYTDALTDYDSNYWPTIRQRVLEERGLCCEKCGITEWNNHPLDFQIHHIDGNRKNNSKDNLMVLCPNCHSQTENYTYKKNSTKISDEDFLEALHNTSNINQACHLLGISANQSAYRRARKLLEQDKLNKL